MTWQLDQYHYGIDLSRSFYTRRRIFQHHTFDIMFRWTTLENTQLDKHYILELLERSFWTGRPRDSLPWLGSILEDRKGKMTMLPPLVIDKIQEGRDCRTLHLLCAECIRMDSPYSLLRALD